MIVYVHVKLPILSRRVGCWGRGENHFIMTKARASLIKPKLSRIKLEQSRIKPEQSGIKPEQSMSRAWAVAVEDWAEVEPEVILVSYSAKIANLIGSMDRVDLMWKSHKNIRNRNVRDAFIGNCFDRFSVRSHVSSSNLGILSFRLDKLSNLFSPSNNPSVWDSLLSILFWLSFDPYQLSSPLEESTRVGSVTTHPVPRRPLRDWCAYPFWDLCSHFAFGKMTWYCLLARCAMKDCGGF